MSNLLVKQFHEHGGVIDATNGKWRVEVLNCPEPLVGSDEVLFDLKFCNVDDDQMPPRRLKLWASDAGLDLGSASKDYAAQIFSLVSNWLSNPNVVEDEIEFFG